MSKNEFVEMIQQFDVEKLSKVRGAAHDGIIGEWIRWWLDLNPDKHLVFNPAPYAKNNTADVLFLKEQTEYGVFAPFGVAEIENNKDKWSSKLKSLATYERELPDLKFVLLCVKTGTRSKDAYKHLIEEVKKVSSTSQVHWIIYRLKAKSRGADVNLVSLKEDDEVYGSNFIDGGEYVLIVRGTMIEC